MKSFDRSKIIPIITGILSIALAIGYLLLVQLLDFRGNLEPAPIEVGLDLGFNMTLSSGILPRSQDRAEVGNSFSIGSGDDCRPA